MARCPSNDKYRCVFLSVDIIVLILPRKSVNISFLFVCFLSLYLVSFYLKASVLSGLNNQDLLQTLGIF